MSRLITELVIGSRDRFPRRFYNDLVRYAVVERCLQKTIDHGDSEFCAITLNFSFYYLRPDIKVKRDGAGGAKKEKSHTESSYNRYFSIIECRNQKF